MNFKPELLAKVLDGTKCQTRRPVKPNDVLKLVRLGEWKINHTAVVRNGRMIYCESQPRAVAPGRGKHGVGHIRLMAIRREDVRLISLDDARAEGFEDQAGFFSVWCGFYDKPTAKIINNVIARRGGGDPIELDRIMVNALADRPAALYDAWALNFCLESVR